MTVACTVAPLGDDQRDAVTRLCGQGNAIEVLVGRAGTGKTYTLAAVTCAYQTAGWDVVGVAPSARAARELEAGAHIPSFTIPRFDHHITDRPLTAKTVVIVDEAGMCGTVDLHHLVTAARHADAKVILVGDCHQLPEVQAGGGLDAAIGVLGDQVCELTVNRRQIEPWEIDALEHLRHGDVTEAWDAYLTHDRVRVADDPVVVQQTAVNDWWNSHAAGSDALLLAGTRSEARALNRFARQRAVDAGTITGPALDVAGRTFQTGDRVLLCRNDANQHTVDGEEFRVDNGMLGDIVHVNHGAGTLDVRLRTGQIVRLDPSYLAAGHLDHGYAMTVHKSQGATCDTVFIVGPAGLYREAVYVALSRARHGAVLYATSRQAALIGERDHGRGLALPGDTSRPDHDLLYAFTQSHAKRFATHTDPHAARIAELATHDLAVLTALLHRAVSVEARVRAAGLTDPATEIAALERAQQARRFLDIGRRVRALDRDNVGVVTAVHDTTGTAAVRFEAEDGAIATRALSWSDLKTIDRPDPVAITPQAENWLDGQTALVERGADEWAEALADHEVHCGDTALLRRAINTRRHTVANQLQADQPAWLTWWLGPRPTDPTGAAVWDDAVDHIAAWRDQHHITPNQPGLGPQPDDSDSRGRWLDVMTDTLRQRTWLDNHHPHPERPSIPSLTAVELAERITKLEQLFATAPPDQTRLIDELAAGRTPAELHAAVATRTDRDRWILANWPYIVEHQELRRLADQYDALAHWPAPTRPAVQGALDTLAVALEPGSPVEERTLAELHRALDDLDPGRRLLELQHALVEINDQVAHLQTRRGTETDPHRQTLLHGDHAVLLARQADARTLVAAERRAIANRAWQPNDTDRLRTAIAHRTNTIYQRAITEHPDWVIELLDQLDDVGSLEQLRPHQIHQLVVDAAIEHDLGIEHSTQTIRSKQPAIGLAR